MRLLASETCHPGQRSAAGAQAEPGRPGQRSAAGAQAEPGSDPIPVRLPQALPDGMRFALVTGVPSALPLAFATLAELARAIHRRRGDDALILFPERIVFQGQARDTVAVHAEDPAMSRRLIGHAWIGGRDWQALRAALTAQVPNMAVA